MSMEAMTLTKAMELRRDCCFIDIVFEIDNENVANEIKDHEDQTTMTERILKNTKKLMTLGFVTHTAPTTMRHIY